ncbi:HTH-type transcriptional repressor PurR (plasmid) [Roseivivax sp. THAF40]|uniref:LacI family DNA-binding transcriptional regulator n=1 Tax=unclassified Roseivivax TaxID=2639302 RepID=UPI001268B1C4|nr:MULTISPECIES: LacI family DNA-binding transcriptional regulator [unclassified Roseivivax]QFS84944.1 HTH-type transcriptional repressor PurR [Roseivivax sp. THAF197b]QFT48645.1 HTH-type transcriptional repressor PurR [Roseivivax sp. THAF40]
MANLQDVAKAAGVSKTTVSRFLNGSLELPTKTADQINGAIRDLNYKPNPHARRLSLGRTDTIALIVPDIAAPFFATFVAAVEEEADNHGKALALYATLNRRDREFSYIDLVRQGHADGLLFVTNHQGDARLAERINTAGPCVVVDEDVAGADVSKIFCDNAEGGRLAGQHLAEAGHRHVLFIGGVDEMISGQRRFQGFTEGMEAVAGKTCRIERAKGPYTVEAGRIAGSDYVRRDPEERPTAIFATSDELLIGLFEVLREADVSVPNDVSVIGFDDVGPLHLFAPAVTAVRQPVRDLGRRAFRLLLDLPPPDQRSKLPQEELLPVTLVKRDSVAPLAARP